jgi:hypothetical protein
MSKLRISIWLAIAVAACSSACQRARTSEPEIVGSARFSNQVHHAILLLKARDPEAYVMLTTYVGRLQEGNHSGMWAYKTPPTYEMTDDTAFYSLTWCAATMAHDSFHSKLYQDFLTTHEGNVPDAVWTGTAAERECMQHQLEVMNRIGATQMEINYAKQQADGHYVKEHETWEDYKKRNW